MVEKTGPRLESVTIVIDPSADDPNVLPVQDAMRQVLDAFELLTPEAADDFLWNLKLASTNSPLTVVGEPYSKSPDVNVAAIAFEQKAIVEENFRALSEGKRPSRRLTTKRRETYKRIFKRNLDGIGRTSLALGARAEPVLVTPKTAALSVKTLNQEEDTDFQSLFLKDRSRSEIGSLEGALIEVGTDYHTPAVLIVERHTNQEVWCRVSADVRDKISAEMTLNDVWRRSRVIVRGRIRYSSDGSISRIWAHDLTTVSQRPVGVEHIADEGFTSGKSIHEYLERLREGEIG